MVFCMSMKVIQRTQPVPLGMNESATMVASSFLKYSSRTPSKIPDMSAELRHRGHGFSFSNGY